MNATLPHGLISIGHTETPKDSSAHYADVLFERCHVLHSFWKVHAIRHRVSKDPSDFRCQNLFWRTWTDPILSRTITTATLTSLWSSCQQEIDSISLRNSLDLAQPVSRDLQKDTSLLQRHSGSPAREGGTISTPSFSLTSFSPAQRSQLPRKPDTRRVSIDEGTGLGISTDPGAKSPRSSRPGLTRTASSSNRISFGASASRTKGRPSMNRRKSSQGGVSQVKPAKGAKSAVKSPSLPSKDAEMANGLLSGAEVSTFELPSASSWEDEPMVGFHQPLTSKSLTDNPSDLVDPNFRNKFAERIASSGNLSSMNRIKKTGSVVRFADEVPAELKKIKTNEIRPTTHTESRPSLPYRGSASSIASVAVIDEDVMPIMELPRTKSQLSMLIEEKRAQSGRDYPLEPDVISEHVGLSSRRKRDPTDHEKVLAMAHGEGVTRSGGRQIRKGFKFSDGDESRWSSPSPPPIF